jgi:hypothetical protein
MPRGNAHLTGSARAESIARYRRLGRRGWEKKQEREEAVTVNVAPELMPLWNRVGRSIKGTPQERLEAFEHYVHENDNEAVEAMQDAADAKLEAMIAERMAS